MALLDSFYGETPAYLGGLLGEDELKRLQGQAQSQSNLGMAAALLQAGAPSRTPGGGALAIAQGLQQGQQLYKQALNQGLQEKMQALQVGDLIRKRQEDEAVRKFLPQIFQAGQPVQTAPAQLTMYGQPTQGVVRDDEGNMMPGGAEVPAQYATGPSTINREALQRLALVAPEQFAKYSAGLKALQPEYKEVNGQLYEISPYGGTPKVVGGAGKLTYQDLGNVVVALDASGKEVGRMPKGSAPSGPTSMQALETENGYVTFNPKTGGVTPITMGGQPLAGKGGKMTEDESKATGWLIQAKNAYKNMNEALAESKEASNPSLVSGIPLVGGAMSNVAASAPQQKFRQGTSALTEALLRAATGAGMNESEAKQKAVELTPQIGDSAAVIAQKNDAIPLYIASLEARAGKKGTAIAEKIVTTPPVKSIVNTQSEFENKFGIITNPKLRKLMGGND